MGESFPLLAQYEDLFYTIPHTVLVLPHICEDILKFHRILLRYFQRPRQLPILLLSSSLLSLMTIP